MAVFAYTATDAARAAVAGTVIADTPRQARNMLRDRGLSVTGVRQVHKRTFLWLGRRGKRRDAELAAFARDLSTLLSVGIPLLTALETLGRQHSRRFRTVIQRLSDHISSGGSLGSGMAEQDEIFDELCVSIVRVGENTGKLDLALTRLADFKERSGQLRSRVLTALAYPLIVSILGLAVTIFLMTYVVPNLLSTLIQADKPLPGLTRAVKTASDLLLDWWWLMALAAVAVVTAFKAALSTDRGARFAHRTVLKIPLLGDLIRKENTSRIAVVLATLLRSGLQFIDAVRITRRTIRNRVFRQVLEDYEQAVAAGSNIAEPLQRGNVFSPVTVRMLAVGQDAGRLEEMLEELAASNDRQVAVATQRLTAVLEPLLILALALLVGLIALATILPILEVSNVL